MTLLPTDYVDGQTIHGVDVNSWTTAINTNRPGMLLPCQGSVNTETLTISGGSVTTIAGTTANGYTPSVGDRLLIFSAPTSSGAATGYTFTSQPANGIYVVIGNTTNLTVARSADMSGSFNPAGLGVLVLHATWPTSNLLYYVTSPNTASTFTIGTTAIQFGYFGGPGGEAETFTINGGYFNVWNGTGFTEVTPTGSAGTQTLALPAGSSDTLVGRASVDTLINKTLTSPVLTTPVLGTPSSGNLANCTFPTLNQSTTGNAATATSATTAGACSGNAATATALATARTVETNLASTTAASFNGSANITPGVTGTLPIANGGTGATSAAAALSALGGIGSSSIAAMVSGSSDGTATALTLWIGTTAEYTALGSYSSTTVYVCQ